MPSILCVIPSRIGSTRLPRKPLLPIQGKPMVQWTYENASRCQLITKVIVATDSEEIANVIRSIGGNVMMTDTHIQTGSERAAAVAEHYPEMDIVINLQGDEPFIQPHMLEELVSPFMSGESPDMTTLAYPLIEEKYLSPDSVKVITDKHMNAIYFSRSPIPYFRTPQDRQTIPMYNHMGLYAFKRDFLLHFKTLAQTPLEMAESLEQLRAIENGYKIRVCLTKEPTLEINTQGEYEQAQHFKYVVR